MSIEDYSKKQLFGSVEKAKLPGNLTDYHCDLVIEEYAQVSSILFRVLSTHKSDTLDLLQDMEAKFFHSI